MREPWGNAVEDEFNLLPEEIEAFKRRAIIALDGESGSHEFPYLSFVVTIFCDNGKPRKMKVVHNGVAIQRQI